MGFAKITLRFCTLCGCTLDALNGGAPMKCGSADDTLYLVVSCMACQTDAVVEQWVDQYHGDGTR